MPLELFTEGEPIADSKAPTDVPIGERWSERRFRGRLVNPANRRKMTVIVVGTGLAGGSVHRLFYDTVKGGDFRSRENNVHRLAEVSVNIIDQCVAQGVPFAREYGGLLANRSFGGAQVSRTFYARGQTGQ